VRSSELYDLLDRPDDVGGLRTAISGAMPAFQRGRAERGRSSPIVINSEGLDLLVTGAHLAHLCEEFLQGQLDALELEYIGTALELCPDFRCASPAVEEALFLLSTPVANGPLTPESVREIIRSLSATRGLTNICS